MRALKLKKTDKILTLICIIFLFCGLAAAAFYNSIYNALGDITAYILWIPIIVFLVVFIFGIWRLLFSLTGKTEFRAWLLFPIAVSLVALILFMLLLSPVNQAATYAKFKQNQEKYLSAVQTIKSLNIESEISELDLAENNIDPSLSSTGTVKVFNTQCGLAVLFFEIKTDSKDAGFIYIERDSVLYTIIDYYSYYNETYFNYNFSYIEFFHK